MFELTTTHKRSGVPYIVKAKMASVEVVMFTAMAVGATYMLI